MCEFRKIEAEQGRGAAERAEPVSELVSARAHNVCYVKQDTQRLAASVLLGITRYVCDVSAAAGAFSFQWVLSV